MTPKKSFDFKTDNEDDVNYNNKDKNKDKEKEKEKDKQKVNKTIKGTNVPHERLILSSLTVLQQFSPAENFRKLWESLR